jgi:hypothetical protein
MPYFLFRAGRDLRRLEAISQDVGSCLRKRAELALALKRVRAGKISVTDIHDITDISDIADTTGSIGVGRKGRNPPVCLGDVYDQAAAADLTQVSPIPSKNLVVPELADMFAGISPKIVTVPISKMGYPTRSRDSLPYSINGDVAKGVRLGRQSA